jgi:hypothetical protein
MDAIFRQGLHEFLTEFLHGNAGIANAVAEDFYFV